MLVHSDALTHRDLTHWERMEKVDRMLAAKLPLEHRANQARQVITDFMAAGRGYASTSWGKDSMVLAHLCATLDNPPPLVWVRVKHWENPDCPKVRDVFFDQYPHMRDVYEEIEVEATAARWWEDPDGERPATQRTSRGGFDEAGKRHGARHISGVRAEESRHRRMAMARWGTAGPNAARPIGYWDAIDVFAYLYAHDLPVHPAYAMSVGGGMDRRWLRVSSLGGIRGADKQRAEWEERYYGDHIDAVKVSLTNPRKPHNPLTFGPHTTAPLL